MAEITKTGKSDAPADSASTSPPASQAGDPSITGPFKTLDSIKRKKVKKKGGKKRKLGLSCTKPNKKAWVRAYPDAEAFSLPAKVITVESALIGSISLSIQFWMMVLMLVGLSSGLLLTGCFILR